MRGQNEPKKQVTNELKELRHRIIEEHQSEGMRKQTEEALRESKERYRTILEEMEEGYFETDLVGNLTFINNAGCRHLGYSRQELIGMNNRVYADEENAKKVFHAFNKAYKTGEPCRVFDYEITRKDGTKAIIELSTALRRNSEGEPIGFRGISRNVTEQKKMEKALRQSEEKYRSIVENMQEVYYEIDLAGNWIFLNDAFYEHLGYRKEELIGKKSRQYQDETTARELFQAYTRLYNTGEPIRAIETKWISKDGAKRTYEMSASLIRDSEGKPIGFRGISRDITERKRTEQALKESEETAKRLAQENAVVAEIGRIINSTLNIEEVYQHFAEEVRKLISFDRISINIINAEREAGIVAYAVGVDVKDKRPGDIFPLKDSMTGEVMRVQSGLLVQTEDVEELKTQYPGLLTAFQAGLRSVMSIPIFSKDKVIGSLQIRSLRPNAYTETDMRLAERVSNQIAGAIANTQLLAKIKQGEELLKKEREVLFAILNNAPYGILMADPEDRCLYVNPEFTNITGYTFQDVPTVADWFDNTFLDSKYRQRAIENWKKGRLRGETVDRESNITCKNGQTKRLEIRAVFLEDKNVVVAFYDVTERKRAEEQLSKLFRAVKQSPATVMITDTDANIEYVNPKFTQLTGYTLEEVIGKNPRILKSGETPPEEYKLLWETITSGREWRGEFHNKKKNGDLYWESASISLVKNPQGLITHYVAVKEDITERKRTEEERATLQEQLRQSQKMEAIGRLAGGVAHDFNNLLTVIKGYCQLSLTEMKESAPIRDTLEVIYKAAEKAADLTRQLLAFSRRQIMEVTVLDINILLRNLDKMLRRIIGEDIELVTSLGENLGTIKADPGQIEQVVMNLAVNAKDAMSKGGKLTIGTANVELDNSYARAHVAVMPGRYVMIAVSDTGTGMAPEVRDRVFEPFFTTKGKGKGTGLGLSTVYGIVKQSGGNIWVYSEPGRGTTLKIYFPRVDEPAEKLKAQVGGEELPRGSETILIVEDDKEVRKLTVRILMRQGYTVLDGGYGDDAFNVCRQHKGPIHLLVTDVVMPGINGRVLSESLSQLHPEMKVLYMSGYTEDAIIHHGVMEKAMNFIQKPFTVSSLTNKVREVLDKALKGPGCVL